MSNTKHKKYVTELIKNIVLFMDLMNMKALLKFLDKGRPFSADFKLSYVWLVSPRKTVHCFFLIVIVNHDYINFLSKKKYILTTLLFCNNYLSLVFLSDDSTFANKQRAMSFMIIYLYCCSNSSWITAFTPTH